MVGENIAGERLTCPKCGRQSRPGTKFCGFDGTTLVQQAVSEENHLAAAKLCPICQKTFPAYASYCPDHRVKLTEMPAAKQQPHLEASANETPDLSVVDNPFASLVGQTIEGKYRLEQYLGEGGMAIVYKATQLNIDRPVVLKVMQWQLIGNEKAIKRFEQEARFTARVMHPNVVSLFDVGFVQGNRPYLVMEYIAGESLRDRLDREGSLPLPITCAVMLQICRGLQEAHNAGLIHRDLKPENILLQNDSERPDWVKIVDFGIAHLVVGYQRLTKTGNITGTFEYVAPEQLRDTQVDTRADIYALGVVLFEMITGTVPFNGETTESILLKQLLDPPPAPSSLCADIEPDSPFDLVVLKALEKDPENRYQTATEMRLALEQIYNQLMLHG